LLNNFEMNEQWLRLKDVSRVNIIGTSGSGKSTFGKRLSESLRIQYLQMDQLYWGPNWYEPSDEEFFPKLKKALGGEKWVLDGNYTRTTHIKWESVQVVIWLDLPFHTVLYRIIKRSLLRAVDKRELWSGTGNRESFRKMLFGRDCMIRWMLKTYGPNRKKYNEVMKDERFSHIRFIRLSTPKKVELFLREVGK